MKILVFVKEVPDTYGDRDLDLETGLADRGAVDGVPDEIGERALEVALTHADANPGTEVSVVSMGPDTAIATVRKGLAMGARDAMHIVGDSLRGADHGITSEVLAAAATRAGFDLIITGNLSTDGVGGVIPAMVAEHLGVPQLTSLSNVTIEGDRVSGTRVSDAGTMRVSSTLPAVISITEALPDARFPNFKGVRAAKTKPLEVLSPADLGIDPDALVAGRSIMLSVARKPAREAGIKIIDEGDAARQLADFLAQNRLL